jgi:hypothetical protein
MNLKLLIDGKGERYLATETGEILGMFGLDDPEWPEVTMKAGPRLPMVAKIVIETTKIEYIGLIIDGSVVPSNALPEAPRALPAPRPALSDPEYVEARLDQLREPFFRDDAFEEGKEEDFMEGLCICCAQELCLQCGRCCTPACEEEDCACR